MSVLDIKKNKELDKVKKRKENPLKPLDTKKKDYFSRIRTAVKKQK